MGVITRQTRSSGRNNARHPAKVKWMKIIKGLVGKRIVALMLASLTILVLRDMQKGRGKVLNVGVPPDLVVRGKREVYAPVPEPRRGQFYIEEKHKGYNDVFRAFNNRGWTLAKNWHDAHIVYQSKNMKGNNYYRNLKPWQRYSRVPGISTFESKDGFFAGFQEYQEKHPDAPMYFIPKTFRLKQEQHREAFREELEQNGGMGRPWVLKNVNENNGQGIEMLGPNSKALKTAAERVEVDKNNTYIAQEYICNELVWSGGQKFDLRMFWVVASVDPLIVLYHDGYARVAASSYDETDFSSTGKHLTNHEFRGDVQISDSTKDHLWELVRNHYNTNRRNLSKKIRIDPVEHVRNQMKESLGAMVSAFRHVAFANSTVKTKMENLFGFYGCDFLIDNDLDVYFIESQASPGFGKPNDVRVDMYRDLFRPMIDTVQEINQKQELDARANLLPLQNLGGWEIVYAGDWQFSYKGYERSKHKKGCDIAA